MLLDLILGVIILINVLLGLKRGLLVMLGRLVILILILAVTLLMVGPLTDFLVKVPFLQPLAGKIGDSILKPLAAVAANIGTAIESFGLPKILADWMQSQLPTPDNAITQAYPQFTEVLFRFALNAGVFILLFILIAVVVGLLTRVMTRGADKLPLVGAANRLGGLVAGLAFGLLQTSVLLLVLGFLAPYFSQISSLLADSWLAGRFFKMDILSFIF